VGLWKNIKRDQGEFSIHTSLRWEMDSRLYFDISCVGIRPVRKLFQFCIVLLA
jgi:hypothetical protein